MRVAWNDNYLKSMIKDNYCIDKTQDLEKGIEVFPSIFIEGAAASGKTVAVNMLLARHPEAEKLFFLMDEEQGELARDLELVLDKMKKGKTWVVFENMDREPSRETAGIIAGFIDKMPETGRAFLASREKPAEEFLTLLWKRKMDIVSQKSLRFTVEETALLVARAGGRVKPEEAQRETGGWAGCTDLLLRLSAKAQETTARELMRSYEIRTFIRKEILGSLNDEEREIIRRAAVCPWLNGEMCREVWDLPSAEEVMENLERKGFLYKSGSGEHWKIAPALRSVKYEEETEKQTSVFWKRLGAWYEARNHIKEFLYCLKKSGDTEEFRTAVIRHYDKIPFLEAPFKEVKEWKENIPELCYLRGMYCYFTHDLHGLDKEIKKIEKMQPLRGKVRELYMNLTFVKPDLSLDGWLELLQKYGRAAGEEPIRLYNILGGSCTFLCGLRDLSGMFACSRKEEKHKADIWKEYLDDDAWAALMMARTDYYIETSKEKDQDIPEKSPLNTRRGVFWNSDKFKLAELYLLYRSRTDENSSECLKKIKTLENSLFISDSAVCRRNARAVRMFYFSWLEDGDRIIHQIHESELNLDQEMAEYNYVLYWNLARVLFLVKQYDKVQKILKKLIPFLAEYHRVRFLAESLFLQAMTDWEQGNHSRALRNMLELFVGMGKYRFVRLYTDYGARGREVLSAYIDWMKKNSPDGWHRKKKYNYGNVRNMPTEDYLELILRSARHPYGSGGDHNYQAPAERLTMMETVILQNIGRGKTNAQICEELNLKLSTVKSHIYSLYKKLGVNTRIQATIKGKEMGILK